MHVLTTGHYNAQNALYSIWCETTVQDSVSPLNFHELMNLESKKISLPLLALTSVCCTRVLFTFLNDPEGPNLPIVLTLSFFTYLLSLTVYFYPAKPFAAPKRIGSTVFAQVLIVTGLYLWLV